MRNSMSNTYCKGWHKIVSIITTTFLLPVYLLVPGVSNFVPGGNFLMGTAYAAESVSQSVYDVLNPDFIAQHGGKSVTVNADAGKSPFDVLGAAFGTDNPVEGVTNNVRSIIPTAQRHVENVFDSDLNKEAFKVEVHGNDCTDGCYLHNADYDPATGQWTGGNNDRQRIEIRPNTDTNTDWIGLENDITAYSWNLKIDKDFPKPDGFCHIFQYKAVNAATSSEVPGATSSENGAPILSLTISTAVNQNVEFRYTRIGTEAGQEILASVPLSKIKDKWVSVSVKILNSDCGWVTMTMKDVKTGEIYMQYNDPDRVLDTWRRPEIKYNTGTSVVSFESAYPAVSDQYNRPKWGIYRKADKSNNNLLGGKIYLSDINLNKCATAASGVSSVNLALGKKAYNIGAASTRGIQNFNAIPARLTDGVEVDPAIYPVSGLTVTDAVYSTLFGQYTWMGTDSSKKGHVILDLGKAMNFNQLKVFAKSMRLKDVNVYTSVETATYSDPTNLGNILFTKIDNGSGYTYLNTAATSDDTKDAPPYVIDLGQTYLSRYIKLDFENGSGSASDTALSGPPRISEVEVFNRPQIAKNVKVSYTSGQTATISWDQSPADYFTIYDGSNVLVDNVHTNSYNLTNLDPGADYSLSVKASYTDQYSFKPMLSAASNTAVFKTDGNPILPNPPATVTATAASDTSINVSWDTVTDAQSYRIMLVTDACERLIKDAYIGTSYTITDLSPDTKYSVKIYSIRRGAPSNEATTGNVQTTGINNSSDNLLYNKEVQISSAWNNDTVTYGGKKALDNDTDASRWVALKGSTTAWLIVDIGQVTPVSRLEYYSYQNKLKKVSFYYATDGEAFLDPNSAKWTLMATDDRGLSGKYGNPSITKIEESISLSEPVTARFIKFAVEDTGGNDININEVKAFGVVGLAAPSWSEGSLAATDVTTSSVKLNWNPAIDNEGVTGYKVYNGNTYLATVAGNVYSYDVTGLDSGKEYTFTVQAGNAADLWSVDGPSATVKTLADNQPVVDTELPVWGETKNLNVSDVTRNSLTLTWGGATDNTGITNYEIFIGDTSLATVAGNVYSYDVTGLKAGTTFVFIVQAADAAKNLSIDGPSVTVQTYNNNSNNAVIITPSTPVVTLDKPVVDTITGIAKVRVDKYVLDRAFKNANADADRIQTVTLLIPKAEGAVAYNIVLPSGIVNTNDAAKRIELKTDIGVIEIPCNMLNSVAADGSETEFKITLADISELPEEVKAEINNKPVIDMSLSVGGKDIEFNNPGTPVTVSIPYKPTEEELKNTEHIVVWYIDEEGKVKPVPSGKYNAATGTVTFTTTHFSKYAVAFVEKTFDDIKDFDWAKQAIEVLASKGVIKGTSDKIFEPGTEITRADYTVLLVKALGLTAKVDANFSDVKATDYYYNELGIARALGIAAGGGNNTFNPNGVISRQDMMTLTAKAMTIANKLNITGTIADLSTFTDKDSVSAYATENVAKLVKEGIIKGSDGSINPLANATRAEIAVIMYRVYNK